MWSDNTESLAYPWVKWQIWWRRKNQLDVDEVPHDQSLKFCYNSFRDICAKIDYHLVTQILFVIVVKNNNQREVKDENICSLLFVRLEPSTIGEPLLASIGGTQSIWRVAMKYLLPPQIMMTLASILLLMDHFDTF